MKRFFLGLIAVMMGFSIAGCGGGGGTTGNGNTVYIQAGLKDGADGAIFVTYTGASVTANTTAFTIESIPFTLTGTVPLSNVQINNITYSWTPHPPAPVFTPTVGSFAWSGTLTPGGSIDIDNLPVLWPADVARFAVEACGGGYSTNYYDVTLTFSGTEVNTGTPLYTSGKISVYCPAP